MALASLSVPERSPLGPSALAGDYPERCAALYREALAMLPELLDHPDRFRRLWEDEDDELTAAEAAVAAGRVHVHEIADLDLAVVTLDSTVPTGGGHRFGGDHADGLHPMALHAATSCVRVLVADDGRYAYTDRYETWVQYRSRPLPRRVDLAPLADELSALEGDGVMWTATGPGSLTPHLGSAGEKPSSLDLPEVVAVVERALRTAPPAWDPYPS